MTRATPDVSTTVKSAARVMRVLEYVAAVRRATFSEVVSDLDLPSSSAHQLLRTMLSHGFLEFDQAAKQYQLGLRAWEVGRAYTADMNLVLLAQPLLERLTAQTGETGQLARLDGLEVVYLAISESPHPMKLVSAIGKRLFAHGTALGKTLLAALPDQELKRRLEGVVLPRFTRHTIVHHDELLAELERTRARGYGIDDEEYVVGCRCLAMLVRDADGAGVAAVSVSIPTARYDAGLERLALASLASCAGELSARFGYTAGRQRADGSQVPDSPKPRGRSGRPAPSSGGNGGGPLAADAMSAGRQGAGRGRQSRPAE